jgi:hypothetical protein
VGSCKHCVCVVRAHQGRIFPFVIRVLVFYTLVTARLFAGAQQVQLAGRSAEECNTLCIFGRAV